MDKYQEDKINQQKQNEYENEFRLTPWISIWVFPRDTIRHIVDKDPNNRVLLLAVLFGISVILDRVMGLNLGDNIPIFYLFAIIFFGGIVFGLFTLYVGGVIFRWIGSLLGGVASYAETRAAIAWSLLPTLIISLLNLPILALFRDEAFSSISPRTDAFLHSNLLYLQLISIYSFVFLILGFFFSIWGFVILLKTIAEVHRFSVWKGLMTVAIPIMGLIILLTSHLTVSC
jgi:hypothetical protein